MTVNDVVAKRVSKLLAEKNISQYRLEQNSGVRHSTIQCIMNGRNKTVTLRTVKKIANGFNMSLREFFADEIFLSNKIEFE